MGREGQRQKWRSRPVSRVLSWTTIPLGPASPLGSSSTPGCGSSQPIAPLFGLAPSGVYRALRRCPRRRWALTPPFHPYHAWLPFSGAFDRPRLRATVEHPVERHPPFGGLFSVALAVGLRRPGVTWHSALWSPDFPRRGCPRRGCLGRLRRGHCLTAGPGRQTAPTTGQGGGSLSLASTPGILGAERNSRNNGS